MPNLILGSTTVITENAGTATINAGVQANYSFNNKLMQIAKNATDTSLQTSSITSTSFTWANSGIEVSITPNKAGNLLIIHGNNSGYNDSNDMRSVSTFLISSDNGSSFINIATDANGHNFSGSIDYLTNFYHYSGTDFGVGGGQQTGYYTVQNTNPLKIRQSHRVTNGTWKYYAPHIIICYEYEVIS
tara:strand:- start:455 stop:1018 length:564 start_codon:yes stop_codon:yes gene_type:complete